MTPAVGAVSTRPAAGSPHAHAGSGGPGRVQGRRPAAALTRRERDGTKWLRLRNWGPWAAGLLIALTWDRAVYIHLAVADAARLEAMKSQEWYVALRALGSLYPWLALAVVFTLIDAGRRVYPLQKTMRRGVFLFLCAALSGAGAEILKPLVGRFKPEVTDGWYSFAPVTERLKEWHDLGMASSHAAVAFGAAFALSILMPRAAVVFIAGAIGCAMTRLLAGAHFLSDVYIAVLLSYGVTRFVYLLDMRNNRGVPIA